VTLLGVRWSETARGAADLVDFIEVSGWTPAADLPPLPRILHNLDMDFSLTTPGQATAEWLERLEEAVSRTGTPWLSLHLGFSAEQVQFDDGMRPRSPVLDAATTRERIVAAARYVHERLSVPLLLENLDYTSGGAYEHICDAGFIAEVIEAVDCGLLLDLAHLQVSAAAFGLEPREYMRRLPLERVVELHVSSPRRVGGLLEDTHHELTPGDEELFSWVLGQVRPRAVVLEYGRDAGLLKEQLERLREILGASGTTVAPSPLTGYGPGV
jgi:uncharacterized protein (UPF0276 family)